MCLVCVCRFEHPPPFDVGFDRENIEQRSFVVVNSVASWSAGDLAGLRRFDVLVKVRGARIRSLNDIVGQIREQTSIEFQFLRPQRPPTTIQPAATSNSVVAPPTHSTPPPQKRPVVDVKTQSPTTKKPRRRRDRKRKTSPKAHKLSSEETAALANYAAFHRRRMDTVSIMEVRKSAGGVAHWSQTSNIPRPPPAHHNTRGSVPTLTNINTSSAFAIPPEFLRGEDSDPGSDAVSPLLLQLTFRQAADSSSSTSLSDRVEQLTREALTSISLSKHDSNLWVVKAVDSSVCGSTRTSTSWTGVKSAKCALCANDVLVAAQWGYGTWETMDATGNLLSAQIGTGGPVKDDAIVLAEHSPFDDLKAKNTMQSQREEAGESFVSGTETRDVFLRLTFLKALQCPVRTLFPDFGEYDGVISVSADCLVTVLAVMTCFWSSFHFLCLAGRTLSHRQLQVATFPAFSWKAVLGTRISRTPMEMIQLCLYDLPSHQLYVFRPSDFIPPCVFFFSFV